MFAGLGVDAAGAEDEVEAGLQGRGDAGEAAGAEQFELATNLRTDAEVFDGFLVAAVFDEQFDAAFDPERAGLTHIRGVIDVSCGNVEIERERLIHQLGRFNDHHNPIFSCRRGEEANGRDPGGAGLEAGPGVGRGDAAQGEHRARGGGDAGLGEVTEAPASLDLVAGDGLFEDGAEEDEVGTGGVGRGGFPRRVAADADGVAR